MAGRASLGVHGRHGSISHWPRCSYKAFWIGPDGRAVLGEKPGDGVSENRGRALLLAESIGAGVPSRGGTGQRRIDKKLNWKRVAPYTSAQLEPVESRHLYVNDCQGRSLTADRLPCLNAVRGFKNDVSHLFKRQPRLGPHILVVVHHQDRNPCRGRQTGDSALPAADSTLSVDTVKQRKPRLGLS